MIKKTLSHGLKVLKISTWVSAISALIILLVVAFFTAFPALIKPQIENQLSQTSGTDVTLERISFDFEGMDMIFNVHNASIASNKTQARFAHIDRAKFNVDLMNLIDDIYHPSDIRIDTLSIYPREDKSKLSVGDMKRFASTQMLAMMPFLKSLDIGKTVLHDKQTLTIGHANLSKQGQQLLLTVSEQKVADKVFDIQATFSAEQLDQLNRATIPVRIDGEFSLFANLDLYEDGDDFAVFTALAPDVAAKDIALYTQGLLPEDVRGWMDRGFQSGSFEDIKLTYKKNLSNQSKTEFSLSAYLRDSELIFNSDWQALKKLNASLVTDGKKVSLNVDSTQLNNLTLENVLVEIPDTDSEKLDVEVFGKIDANSQAITQFLAELPLGDTTHEILEQFTITGEANGEVHLVIPLDDRETNLKVDLDVNNNRLTTLNDALVIENYNSKLAYDNGQITGVGVGSVRDIEFDIHINPKNRADDVNVPFAVEFVNNESGFEGYVTKREDESWRMRIESDSLKGNAQIVLDDNAIPKVSLLGFQVSTLDAIKGDWKIEPKDFPNMALEVREFFVDGEQLPNFRADLSTKYNILNINNLIFEGLDLGTGNLIFNGYWLDGKTRLWAQAKGEKLSKFLEGLKVKEKVTGGEFDIDIRLACECAPWNMNHQDITGIVAMEVKQGVFTEKDPNIGRVLSLLNIKSIAKRLKLEIGDIVQKGFAYESIEAGAYVGNGLAEIEKFELNATSGVINLTGKTDIIEKEYDLEAKVIPAVGDAVPAATALAGGGFIGLGIWLADDVLFDGKMIDRLVGEALEFEYKITGSWDNPVIEKAK